MLHDAHKSGQMYKGVRADYGLFGSEKHVRTE